MYVIGFNIIYIYDIFDFYLFKNIVKDKIFYYFFLNNYCEKKLRELR